MDRTRYKTSKKTPNAFIARDQLGIKTLYLYSHKDSI